MRIILIIRQIKSVKKCNGIPLLKTSTNPQVFDLEVVNKFRDELL